MSRRPRIDWTGPLPEPEPPRLRGPALHEMEQAVGLFCRYAQAERLSEARHYANRVISIYQENGVPYPERGRNILNWLQEHQEDVL